MNNGTRYIVQYLVSVRTYVILLPGTVTGGKSGCSDFMIPKLQVLSTSRVLRVVGTPVLGVL